MAVRLSDSGNVVRIVDLLERAALHHPDRAGVAVLGGPELNFRGLRDRVLRIAGGLDAAGVARGDRVALVADNGLAFFDVYLAVAYLGAAAVPINTQLTRSETDYILSNAEPRVTVADPQFLERVSPALAGELKVTGSPTYDELTNAPLLPDIDRSKENDVALVIYTSGTTGGPKGVCLTQKGLAFNGLTMALVQRFRGDDIYLSTTPLYHAATGTRVSSMLADCQTHVVLPKFSPEAFFEAVQKHRVTITVVVPAQLRQLVDHPARPTHDLSSLRLIVYGAAPTAGPLIRRVHSEFGCDLYQGYGISECVTNLTGLLPEDHDRAMHDRPELLDSCGRVVQGVRIQLRDPSGNDVPTGEVGEVWVQTEKVMAGYWRDPERTAEALVDGWFRTGDLARADADGYYFIVGRLKDMLISGGVNVYPSEIEAVLYDHPAVQEVAVVGGPDPEWGERPVAFVELAVPTDHSELETFCTQRLAKVKVPDAFIEVDEFPRTATGKIRKVELRARLAEGSGR
ncbi:MAG: class I adenylate-forming enzyme family protein [Acidimicrobiales bacterium]